jgi:hypothetical protein
VVQPVNKASRAGFGDVSAHKPASVCCSISQKMGAVDPFSCEQNSVMSKGVKFRFDSLRLNADVRLPAGVHHMMVPPGRMMVKKTIQSLHSLL